MGRTPLLDRLPTRGLIESTLAEASAEPGDPERHANLGMVYQANMMYEEAQASYRNAVALAPDNIPWRHRLALALEFGEQPDQALAVLRDIVERAPEFAPSWQRLGSLLLERSQIDAAEAAFRRVTELAPGAKEGYTGLGQVLLARRDHAGAVEQLTRAIAIDPDNRQAHYALGLAYRALGRTAEAEFELELGKEAPLLIMPDPLSHKVASYTTNHITLNTAALRHLDQGRPEEAVKLLELALRSRPDDLVVLSNLAGAWILARRYELALPLLERILEEDPGHGSAYVNLGECLGHLGRFEEALSVYGQALNRGL